MPEVFRERGWVAKFYSNKGNEPIHIHIRKADGEAKFWVANEVMLEASEGLKTKEVAEAELLVKKHADAIRTKWNEHFAD